MDFIPGYFSVFRFLHSLSALTFCVVMTAMYVTGSAPARIGSRRTLLLALYAFFKVIVTMTGIELQSGSLLPNLEFLHLIFYMTEFSFLLAFALSLMKTSPLRIAVYTGVGCFLTFGALLVSGRCSVFFPMVFLALPSMMLSGSALFSLARETENVREKNVYKWIGLLQILYFFLMVPVVIQYLPVFAGNPLFADAEPFIRLFSSLILLAIAGFFYSLSCAVEFKTRFLRFLILTCVFACLALPVLYWCVSCGIRKSMMDTRAGIVLLQKELSDSVSAYSDVLNILADSHTLSAADPLACRILAVFGATPIFLNPDGVCVSSAEACLIGMNFQSATPVGQTGPGGIRCVFMRDFVSGKGGFFLARDIVSPDGAKLGSVLLKTSSPLFHFHIPADDSFFVISSERTVLADSSDEFHGARYTKITPYSITLKRPDGHLEVFSGKHSGSDEFHTFAWTFLQQPEFLRDTMLVLCSKSDFSAILSHAGFQIIALCWSVLLLCLCLHSFRRAVAEKDALFRTVRNAYCRDCQAPTVLLRPSDNTVVLANSAAEQTFRVRPDSLTGKKITNYFRSSALLPFPEAVRAAMRNSTAADFLPGFFRPDGTGELFCLFFLIPSPSFMNTDGEALCTLRFWARNDSAEGDPVNASAWLAFVQKIPDPAFLLSESGQIVSGNFHEITGRNPAEISDAFSPSAAQRIRQEAKNSICFGRSVTFCMDFAVGNSVPMSYEILIFPVSGKSGCLDFPLVGVVTRNINKLRRLEESFRSIRKRGDLTSE